MSELMIPSDGLPESKVPALASEAMSAGKDYLRRIQLMTGKQEIVAEGNFPPLHYALIDGERMTDLGDEPDVIFLDERPKAINMNTDPLTVILDTDYDDEGNPTTPSFVKIMELSNTSNSKCMWGMEYLIYVPAIKKFGTLFFGTKTNRKVIPDASGKLPTSNEGKAVGATLKNRKIESKKYSPWWAIVVTACSNPGEPPAIEKVMEMMTVFRNEESTVPETVDPGDTGGRER